MKKPAPKPAPAAPAAPVQTSGPLVMMPIGAITVVKGFNPRKVFGDVGLAELAESIKARGIIQPLVLRQEGNAYQLVAGERRLRAAKLAGLKEVPCLVREVTAEEALNDAVLENLQREDVSAIEEAEGFERLIKAGKFTADTLAAQLGKSREYVYGRLRLLKLDAKVTAALEDGDIEASTAGLLAKFAPAMQPVVLKQLRERTNLSFRECKRDIEEAYQPLTEAPFLKWTKGKCQENAGTKAPLLCFECQHNSANMPDLAGQKKPVCLNADCYFGKVREHGRRRIEDAKKAGQVVVDIPKEQWGYGGDGLSYQSAWKKADETDYTLPQRNGKCTTWREWLKELDVPPALALSPSGQVLEVIKPSEVRALLIEKGKIKPTAHAGKAATKEERRAVIAENKARRAEVAQLGAACLVKARQMDELDFWRWFWMAADKDYRTKDRLAELLQLGKARSGDPELSAGLLALNAQDRQEHLLRAHLQPRVDEWEEGRVAEVSEQLKVTL